MSEPQEPQEICRTCALQGIGCCKTPNAIFISIPESIQIHQTTGLKYSEFLMFTHFLEFQFQEAFTDLLPSGKTLALLHKKNNACVFLTENGCRIPHLKPYVCQVYPCWYDQDVYKASGTISLFIEEQPCQLGLNMEQLHNMDAACRRFLGVSEQELKGILKNAFHYYELARRFEHLFESMNLDDAFAEIEKILLTS
ncbi:MAG: YkgJ family cysteine cluster protein [Candidatus Helarchaeota archaeon]|nr:YkgJ family cysteine cluster protein [Candidatus Helarchaeota archaeon]